jgi:anaerobic selenocysteine-containing dehydrogenase
VAVLWDGIDVAAGRDAAGLVESLVARGADVACFVAGEQGNARGAEALGLVPRGGGLDAAGIFGAARAGTLRVLGLFGVNPLLHHPLGAAAVREALAAVPFVVATELFFTETAELANLVLPARGALEKTGHVYDLTGTPHGVFAAHGAPEGALGDGDILVALAAELSIDIPTPAELRAAAVGPAAPSAARFADAALVGRAPVAERGRTPLGAGELRLALASHIFAGGGTVFFDERLGALRPAPSVTLAPESATLAGVEHGDLVDLELDAGMLEALEVIVEDEAAAGIAIVIDGLPEAPANGFAEGETARIRNVRRSGSVPALGAAV